MRLLTLILEQRAKDSIDPAAELKTYKAPESREILRDGALCIIFKVHTCGVIISVQNHLLGGFNFKSLVRRVFKIEFHASDCFFLKFSGQIIVQFVISVKKLLKLFNRTFLKNSKFFEFCP